jgi:hypothetical protein
MEFDRRELLTGLAATAAALPILPALPAGGVFPVNLDTPEPWSEAHTRAQRALVERLCAKLGIDEAELIRRAGKMFREHPRGRWQERQP